MGSQYWIRWLSNYGWAVWYGSDLGHLYPLTGWRGSDLNHILTWCGSIDVTILQPESDAKYAGAMPDGWFRTLSPGEEAEARRWARENHSATLPDDFSVMHPVVRDEWRKLDGHPA